MEKKLSYSVIQNYSQYDTDKVHALFETSYNNTSNMKFVVLDDDPTGIQTVHDISVYTQWDESSILKGFKESGSLFFILTNSRSFTEAKTEAVHREIAHTVCRVAEELHKPFIMISRCDSTLRGHFPLETETLKNVIEGDSGYSIDGEIVAPFFKEGGRFTIDDVHYVRQADELIPVGMTEFAKDKTFSFTASNLKQWCEEKTHGRIRADSVISIGLTDLRSMNIPKIERQLLSAKKFDKIIVNAVDYSDLEVFCIAFFHALAKGKHYIFRCASSIVKVLGNISSKPLLRRYDLIAEDTNTGGIVIIGSHVSKTTLQMAQLRSLPQLKFIEFNQHLVLKKHGLENEVKRVGGIAGKLLLEKKTVVVYTRRQRIDSSDNNAEKNLSMAVAISDAVASIISELPCRPSFIIAKGGITSSDIGTKSLKVKRAWVLGQIQPGIPVWRTGPESRFPGLPYIIFPGNVGEIDTLKNVIQTLIS